MKARYQLLPLWIKIFSWIFLILLLSPVALIIGYFEGEMEFELWGLAFNGSSFHPYSIVLIFLMTLHGVAALGLISGKRWGIDVGIICGILGGICSIAGMGVRFINGTMHFEFSLILQALFVASLFGIRKKWVSIDNTRSSNLSVQRTSQTPRRH